jgi:sugar transferase (PEP-CTERM system associated)
MSKTNLMAVAETMDAIAPAEAHSPVAPLAPVPRSPDITLPERVTSMRLFDGNVHRVLVLAAAESVMLVLAFYGAILARLPRGTLEATTVPLWPHATLFAGIIVFCVGSMGLYQLRHRSGFAGTLARLVVAVGVGTAFFVGALKVMPSHFIGAGVIAVAAPLALAGLGLVRYGFLRLVDEDFFKRRVLVWGAGARAANIPMRLRRRVDQRGFRVLGYVHAPGDQSMVDPSMVMSADNDLMRFVLKNRIEEVVVAMDDRRQGFPQALLRECRLRGIAVRDIVCFLERESGRVSVELAQPSWLIFSDGFRADFFRLAAKRAFDIAISLTVLALAWPLALAAAIAIWIEDRGPVFYRQVRSGQNGRPFKMIKFRSMTVNAEAKGAAVWAVKNDPRVTRVGAFIRKTRIDELPQVVNVLLGNMSFVGPRPERPAFVETLAKAIPFYAERHFVKPGITGWAQVKFPYGASEDDAREKLGYDLYYVKNHSLVFDIMVILRTVEIVLFRVGSR